MASRFARATARANRVFMDRLSDGLCTYHPANGPDVPDVPCQFDSTFEVFDENGMGRRVRNVLLPVAMVGQFDHQRSEVTLNGKRWLCAGMLEDDGAFVRIEVQ